MSFRDHDVYLSNQTNMRVAFGSKYKVERNVKLTTGLFRMNAHPMTKSESTQETLSDPLHRHVDTIKQARRNEASIMGRSRAQIRSAAPGQATWKQSYWLKQRSQRPIGPFIQGSLESQSILFRMGGLFDNMNKG